jgi:hypothetical protein
MPKTAINADAYSNEYTDIPKSVSGKPAGVNLLSAVSLITIVPKFIRILR